MQQSQALSLCIILFVIFFSKPTQNIFKFRFHFEILTSLQWGGAFFSCQGDTNHCQRGLAGHYNFWFGDLMVISVHFLWKSVLQSAAAAMQGGMRWGKMSRVSVLVCSVMAQAPAHYCKLFSAVFHDSLPFTKCCLFSFQRHVAGWIIAVSLCAALCPACSVTVLADGGRAESCSSAGITSKLCFR